MPVVKGEAYIVPRTVKPAEFTFNKNGQLITKALMTAMAHIDTTGKPVEVVQVRVYDRSDVTRIRKFDDEPMDTNSDVPIRNLSQYKSFRVTVLEDGREVYDATRDARFVRRDKFENNLKEEASRT